MISVAKTSISLIVDVLPQIRDKYTNGFIDESSYCMLISKLTHKMRKLDKKGLAGKKHQMKRIIEKFESTVRKFYTSEFEAKRGHPVVGWAGLVKADASIIGEVDGWLVYAEHTFTEVSCINHPPMGGQNPPVRS